MIRSAKTIERERPSGKTFIPLLCALIVVLVLGPIAAGWPLADAMLVSLVLVAGVFAVHGSLLLRRGMVATMVLVLAFRWFAHVYGGQYGVLVVIAHLAISVYFALITAICLHVVLGHGQVTMNTVLGAVCGYLLIALVFAFAYAVVEDLQPASFSAHGAIPPSESARIGHETPDLLYFSFVTLTTTGYGDIVPTGKFARSLAILQVLIGQLYLSAFVARLVGILGTSVTRAKT